MLAEAFCAEVDANVARFTDGAGGLEPRHQSHRQLSHHPGTTRGSLFATAGCNRRTTISPQDRAGL